MYLFVLLGTWLLLRVGGDRWWFATVMLFGPRWIYGLPLVALAPLACWVRRGRLWLPLTAASVTLLGPLMGLCLPWGRVAAIHSPRLRVLTCNLDGNAFDRARLAALVAEVEPDVVAIQECPADFQPDWSGTWRICRQGELLIASRHPIGQVEPRLHRHPRSSWPSVNSLRLSVETPAGRLVFCNLHLSSPHRGLSTVLDRRTLVQSTRSAALSSQIANRWGQSEDVSAWLEGVPEPVIVAGDFNMPCDSAIYRRFWAEHANAFSQTGLGYGYTKWTPVGGFRYGLRIDHVLAGPGLRPCRAWVGPDIGSDHRPLVADLEQTTGEDAAAQ